jgi:hypothetical protein
MQKQQIKETATVLSPDQRAKLINEKLERLVIQVENIKRLQTMMQNRGHK